MDRNGRLPGYGVAEEAQRETGDGAQRRRPVVLQAGLRCDVSEGEVEDAAADGDDPVADFGFDPARADVLEARDDGAEGGIVVPGSAA